MKRMLKDWAVALCIGAIVFYAIQLLQPKPEIPRIAPDFKVTTIDGDTIHLKSLRGKKVVLNFWATWCGPCKVEAPAFSQFAQSHPEIPVIGLAVDSGSAAQVRRTVREWNISFPVAIADAKLQRSYDISTLPTTVILDENGEVNDIHVGIMSERNLINATR